VPRAHAPFELLLIDLTFATCKLWQNPFRFISTSDRGTVAEIIGRLGQPAGREEWQIVEQLMRAARERDALLDQMTARSPWPGCDTPAGFARWRLIMLLHSGAAAVLDVNALVKIAAIEKVRLLEVAQLAVLCGAAMLEDVLQVARRTPEAVGDAAALRVLTQHGVAVATLTVGVVNQILGLSQSGGELAGCCVVRLLSGAQEGRRFLP
jgi:hypothetical protein